MVDWEVLDGSGIMSFGIIAGEYAMFLMILEASIFAAWMSISFQLGLD